MKPSLFSSRRLPSSALSTAIAAAVSVALTMALAVAAHAQKPAPQPSPSPAATSNSQAAKLPSGTDTGEPGSGNSESLGTPSTTGEKNRRPLIRKRGAATPPPRVASGVGGRTGVDDTAAARAAARAAPLAAPAASAAK